MSCFVYYFPCLTSSREIERDPRVRAGRIPKDEDAGDVPLALEVRDADDKVVAKQSVASTATDSLTFRLGTAGQNFDCRLSPVFQLPLN